MGEEVAARYAREEEEGRSTNRHRMLPVRLIGRHVYDRGGYTEKSKPSFRRNTQPRKHAFKKTETKGSVSASSKMPKGATKRVLWNRSKNDNHNIFIKKYKIPVT